MADKRCEAGGEVSEPRVSDERLRQLIECNDIPQHWLNYVLDLADARAELARVKADSDEIQALNVKLGDILTRTVNQLRGKPDDRSIHSWHGIPDEVHAMMEVADEVARERDALAKQLFDAQQAVFTEGMERNALAAQVAALRDALDGFKFSAAPERHNGTSAYPYEDIERVLADTAAAAAARDAENVREGMMLAARMCGGAGMYRMAAEIRAAAQEVKP